MRAAAGSSERRTGDIRASDYSAPGYLKELQPVVNRAQQAFPDFSLDERSLGRSIAGLLQFMESRLGKDTVDPKPFPKLPVKLLWDFSHEGPLLHVVAALREFQQNRSWAPDLFSSSSDVAQNQCLQLVQHIRSAWESNGFVRQFHIHVDDALVAESQQLEGIVKALGGTLASSPDEPGVTHHVVPYGPNGDPDDGAEYLRTLRLDDGRAMVHWWYHPDSYDGWIPASQAPENLEPDKKADGMWKVYPRFLLDSEKFNEWMNPIDYELEDAGAEGNGKDGDGEAASGSVGGKRTAEQIAADEAAAEAEEAAKRQRMLDALPEILPGEGRPVEGQPGLTQQTVGRPYPAAMDGSARTQNLSQGQHNAEPAGVTPLARAGPVFPPPLADTASASPTASSPVASALTGGTSGPRVTRELMEVYHVPTHSSWFRWDAIHDIERRGVPEFFNGRSTRKTPKAYKEMRDFIINLFRQNKSRKLTFTECRQKLAADVSSVHRLWSFLDHWGLINFMPNSDSGRSTEQASPSQPTIQPNGLPAGSRVLSVPAAAENLFAFSKPTPAMAGQAAASGGNSLGILPQRNKYGSGTPAGPPPHMPPSAPILCNADPTHDCTTVRYHALSVPDVDVCPACYADGRFPIGMSSKDFVRVDQTAHQEDPSSGWTQQETLLLLEALEVYGDSWADVAEHVGTKNQVQCITQFLQLPIEDQFLDEMERSCTGSAVPAPQQGCGEGMPPDGTEAAIPFADVGNPIMAQVAFLATMISPRVAAAAAQRALEVLAEDSNSGAVAAEAATVLKTANAEPQAATDKAPEATAVRPETNTAAANGNGADAEGVGGGQGAVACASEPTAMEVENSTPSDPPAPTAVGEPSQPSAAPASPFRATVAQPATAPVPMEGTAPPGAGATPQPVGTAPQTPPEAPSTLPPAAVTAASAGGQPEAGKPPLPPPKPQPAASQAGEPVPLTGAREQAAAAAALAAAAVKAKLLADQEEREIQRLSVGVIQNQVEKLETKMRYFEELEAALEREKAALETSWMSFFVERTQLAEAHLSNPAPTSTGKPDGEGPPPVPSTSSAAAAATTPGPASSLQTPGTFAVPGMVTPGPTAPSASSPQPEAPTTDKLQGSCMPSTGPDATQPTAPAEVSAAASDAVPANATTSVQPQPPANS